MESKSNTGNVTVHIVAFQRDDPRYQLASGKGNKGLSIAQLRKRFGGDEGEIPDPYHGHMHHMSWNNWFSWRGAMTACTSNNTTSSSQMYTQGNEPYLHPGNYDQSFLAKTADVKQIWDFTNFDQVNNGLSAIRNALNDFQFTYNKSLYPVIGLRGESAVICGLDDAMWKKYHLTLFLNSTTTVATDNNPLYSSTTANIATKTPNDLEKFYKDTSLQALQKRGAHISVCHQALSTFAEILSGPSNGTPESIYKELAAHLVPDAQQTPSGSSLIAVAQHLGFTYAKQ